MTTSYGRLRADQRPLYVQASEALRRLLRGYAQGDRLPSEPELSEQLGISRPTLREALRLLEEEGAIVRRHGVGTFVASPRPVLEAGLEVLESLERMADRSGLSTTMSEFVVEERPATDTELAGLGLTEPCDVTVVTRSIETGTGRVAYLADCVPFDFLRRAELGPEFNGSVLDLMLSRNWPPLSHSRTELAAEGAGAELARRLCLQLGDPLLKLTGHLHSADGRVVDYSTSYFVPGFFRFHVVRRIG